MDNQFETWFDVAGAFFGAVLLGIGTQSVCTTAGLFMFLFTMTKPPKSKTKSRQSQRPKVPQ
jgi:hypothetical protein